MSNSDMPHRNHQYSSAVNTYTSSSPVIDVDYISMYTGGRCRYDDASTDIMVLQTCEVKYSKVIAKKVDHFRYRVRRQNKKIKHYRYYATLLCYALLLPFTGVSLATWTVSYIVPNMQTIPVITSKMSSGKGEHLNYHFVDANNIAMKAEQTHHLSPATRIELLNDIHWLQNNPSNWGGKHPTEWYDIRTTHSLLSSLPRGKTGEENYLASVEHSAGLPYTKQARYAVRRLHQKNMEFRALKYSTTRITLFALFTVLGLWLPSFFIQLSLKNIKKTMAEDGNNLLD